MSTITREQKRKRFLDYMNFFEYKGREFDDDIDAAILADYAPLSEERRAELEWQRSVIQNTLQHCVDCLSRNDEAVIAGNPFFDDHSRIQETFDKYEAWLREIDAELEGDDG